MLVQLLSAAVIVAIAVVFLNPGHLSMPMSSVSMLIIGMIVAFLVYGAFVLKEKVEDEREQMHVLRAGRISYLVGIGALIVGIVVQTLRHDVDPWLVIAVCAMVLSKIASRIYSHFKM